MKNYVTPLLSVFLIVLLGLSFSNLQASIEVNQFDSPQQQTRYQHLIAELRCLVCQNQNLADSDAELAKDLRTKTLSMIKAGNTDREILDYMQERYGDFVLYRPPFNMSTIALWAGPFILLAITFLVLFLRIRKKQAVEQTVSNNDSLTLAQTLLNDSDKNNSTND